MKRSRRSLSLGSSAARLLLAGALLCSCAVAALAVQRQPINSVGGHELRGTTFMPALECYDPYGRPQVSRGQEEQVPLSQLSHHQHATGNSPVCHNLIEMN